MSNNRPPKRTADVLKISKDTIEDTQALLQTLTSERLHVLSPLNVLASGNFILYGTEAALMQEIKNIEKIGRQCLTTQIFFSSNHEEVKNKGNYLDETFVALLKLRMFDKKTLIDIENRQKKLVDDKDFVSPNQIAEGNLLKFMEMSSVAELDKHLAGLVQ